MTNGNFLYLCTAKLISKNEQRNVQHKSGCANDRNDLEGGPQVCGIR